MKTSIFIILLLGGVFGWSSVVHAELVNCRYSKALKEDQFDNTTVDSAACNVKVCAAVVVCDGGKDVSNVVCSMTRNGCPSADLCVKEHLKSEITFAQFESTPYRAPARPEPIENGGGAR